ncbi:MAG: phage/plasmid primase, P4 family [Planctomycetota bacterium]
MDEQKQITTDADNEYRASSEVGSSRVGVKVKMSKAEKIEKFDSSEVTASLDYHLTDMGNGQRLALYYGDKLRFLWDADQWLFWDGRRWSRESGKEGVARLCKKTAIRIYSEVSLLESRTDREQFAKWAIRSESEGKEQAMANMARSEKPISTYSKYFDTDPMQFNSGNWVIDLTNGSVTPQHPEHNLTKLGGCEFDETAICPTWDRCVAEWMDGDEEKVKYLQMILGYCLTGDISARIFPIFHGQGFNGKSKCLDAICEILGDYATLGAEDLLTEKKIGQHPTDIMKLQGRRLVVVDESKKNMMLRTSLVKRMTGDTQLTGRFMRQDFQDFNITHKLILMTQNLPIIKETADAIWDRVHLLRWNRQFDEDERDVDLPDKLRKEYSGILNWLIQGCLNWQKAGRRITRPNAVKQAGLEYRAESDPLDDFMQAKCEFNPRATTTVKALDDEYKSWCQSENIKWILSKRNFNDYLRERGCEKKNVWSNGNAVKCWIGIGIQEN